MRSWSHPAPLCKLRSIRRTFASAVALRLHGPRRPSLPMRRRALALAALLVAACTMRNPKYCENDVDCENGCDELTHTCNAPVDGAPPDARIDCTDHTQCVAWCDPETN